MPELSIILPVILPVIATLFMLFSGVHAIMNVRDSRAAVGWVSATIFIPIFGAALYWVFGVNRVHRRAVYKARKRARHNFLSHFPTSTPLLSHHLIDLALLTEKVTARPLLGGNRVSPLINGNEAYPAMLKAIHEAKSSVSLLSYIFDNDSVGKEFVEALKAAHQRGVVVRVIVDAVGAHYSFPSVLWSLRRHKIRAVRFNPTFYPWHWAYANLRNHRKILVVDGRIGFTGGMNIRRDHVISEDSPSPTLDIHFQFEGPIVNHLQTAFAEDWEFITGERLMDEKLFPELKPLGDVFCRGITAGPDSDMDQLNGCILGAIACARKHIVLASPYFLPESELISALATARLRGITVDIMVPKHNNQRLVKWAGDAIFPTLIRSGCRIYKTTKHFDHSKLIIVDGVWVLLGSSNLDPRSLRLNFEFNVEAHSVPLAERLLNYLEEKKEGAELPTLRGLEEAPFAIRFRNRLARLLVPYL